MSDIKLGICSSLTDHHLHYRDFVLEISNSVLHRSEHDGVQERSAAQIGAFWEMVDVCGLTDIGFSGRSWTFEKRLVGDPTVALG